MADRPEPLGGGRTAAGLRPRPPRRRRAHRRLPPGRRRRPHRPRPLAARGRLGRRPALGRPAGDGQLAYGPGLRRPRHHPAGRLEPADHRGRPRLLGGRAARRGGLAHPRPALPDLGPAPPRPAPRCGRGLRRHRPHPAHRLHPRRRRTLRRGRHRPRPQRLPHQPPPRDAAPAGVHRRAPGLPHPAGAGAQPGAHPLGRGQHHPATGQVTPGATRDSGGGQTAGAEAQPSQTQGTGQEPRSRPPPAAPAATSAGPTSSGSTGGDGSTGGGSEPEAPPTTGGGGDTRRAAPPAAAATPSAASSADRRHRARGAAPPTRTPDGRGRPFPLFPPLFRLLRCFSRAVRRRPGRPVHGPPRSGPSRCRSPASTPRGAAGTRRAGARGPAGGTSSARGRPGPAASP